MGTQYSSQSPSGYNSSPPADDGSTADSNKVKWATHITKIGTPLYNWISAINTALATFADLGPSSKATNYTTVAGDHLKTIEASGTTTITLGSAASMGAGYTVTVKNAGTATVTVATSDTVDGSSVSSELSPKSSRTYQVDAAAGAYAQLHRPSIRGVFMYKTSAQGVSHATATATNYPTASASESYDTDAAHDLTSNSTRITVPSGVYAAEFVGGAEFAADATGVRRVEIFKNGAALTPTARTQTNAASSGTTDIQCSTGVLEVSPTDYFELYVYQSSGGALSITPWFSSKWL